MPLELRFFNATVYKSWQTWDGRIDKHVPGSVKIVLDLPQETKQDLQTVSDAPLAKKRKIELFGTGGVAGVDPTYARFQPVLLKLRDFLAQKEASKECDVCEKQIDTDKELFNICLDADCCSLTHLSCLSRRFVEDEQSAALVPRRGACPSCRTSLEWPELMRVLTLRMRGQKEVTKLLKKRRAATGAVAAEILDESSETDEDVDMLGRSDEEADDSEADDDISIVQDVVSVRARGLGQESSYTETVIQDSEEEG